MSHESTEEEYTFAEKIGWVVDRTQTATPRDERSTAHLLATPQQTLCGVRLALSDSRDANEHDQPCRECSDVADPAGAAALMPGEVPFPG